MRIVLHDTPDGSIQWTCAHGARMWQGWLAPGRMADVQRLLENVNLP